MILVNGHSEHCIDISDRGFQYGDGLFETIKVKNGQPVFFAQHYQRLKSGCERLLLPCPAFELLQTEVLSLCQSSSSAVLKIIVTRGVGGRGYRQPEVINSTRVLSLHLSPDYPAQYQQQGINARFCAVRLGINPLLAGIKHLNRLEQVLARAEWSTADDVQEGVMLDIRDRVVEGTMSNLFVSKDQILYTAPVYEAGVAGIMRGLIMQQAKISGIVLKEQFFSKEFLLAADEVFFCNAVIGIWPVKQLQEQQFAVGEMTKQFMHWLAHEN